MSFKVETQSDTAAQSTERPKHHKWRRPVPPVFDDVNAEAVYRKERLVLAAGIMVHEGFECTGTVLSSRDILRKDTFWTFPAGIALSWVKLEDLVQVDMDGKVIQPGARGSIYDINAIAIHVAIYTGREDINGIIHTHGPNMRAFSMHNKPLSMICQDTCTFYNGCHLLPLKTSLRAQTDPTAIQKVLADGKGLILEQRGGLVVNASIEGCIALITRLEGVCEAQLLAEAAVKGCGGRLVLVGDEEAEYTAKAIAGPHHCWLMARPYFMREERRLAKLQGVVASH